MKRIIFVPFPVNSAKSSGWMIVAAQRGMIAASEALPSTPIELVSRFTEHDVTPSTEETAFSTLALHAAQLIPVILYFCIAFSPSAEYPDLSISQFVVYVKQRVICSLQKNGLTQVRPFDMIL